MVAGFKYQGEPGCRVGAWDLSVNWDLELGICYLPPRAGLCLMSDILIFICYLIFEFCCLPLRGCC